MLRIDFDPIVLRQLKKLDKQASKRILKKIEDALSNYSPSTPGIDHITEACFHRLRIGKDYRAIFEKLELSIKVIYVGRRDEIYKKFEK